MRNKGAVFRIGWSISAVKNVLNLVSGARSLVPTQVERRSGIKLSGDGVCAGVNNLGGAKKRGME